ncbi:MAG: hypothetical protein ACI9VR_000697 [Cognaticolwellia sp.]|jgi:hypothetical protein
MSDFDPKAIVGAYAAAYRAKMSATAAEIADASHTRDRARELPDESRDALDTLILASPDSGMIDPRFRPLMEEHGEALWQGGLILPRSLPKGAKGVDPTYFAAAARLNPALRRRKPFRERLKEHIQDHELSPTFPPSDARFDAVVLSVAVEANPPKLKQDLGLRKDTLGRLMRELGDDVDRWGLALQLAQATGLCRPAGGVLRGFPESTPRAIGDPSTLLTTDQVIPGRLLLQLIGRDWVSFPDLMQVLRTHARQVLHSPNTRGTYEQRPGTNFGQDGWDLIEGPLFLGAAIGLYRARQLDGRQDGEGLQSLRLPEPGPQYEPGFLLTPDLEILVAPEELPSSEYARLARLAPFVEGNRVHRHRLTREGVARDLAAGHEEPAEFLAKYSRTGLPESVRQSLHHWAASAERITLLSGVSILEKDGVFEVVASDKEMEDARELDYGMRDSPVPAAFRVQDADHMRVPAGQDALTVRAALNQVADLVGQDEAGLLYRINAHALVDVTSHIERLLTFFDGEELPGALETAILAAQGELAPVRTEEALILHLPEVLAHAVVRDPVAGPLLERSVAPGQHLVSRASLPKLSERLQRLGIPFSV